MKKLILIMVVLGTASGCAMNSRSYNAVTTDDVAQWIASDVADAERVRLLELATRAADYPLTTYPAACQRKECAGPETELNATLQNSALLLANSIELSRLADRAGHDDEFAASFAEFQPTVARRLSELRAEILGARERLDESQLKPAEFEALAVAHRQLDDAEKLRVRAERQLRDARLSGSLAWLE